MRIVGLGVDLAEIDRVRRVLDRHPDRFPARVFTEHERTYAARYADPVPRLAARFAGKEAVMKSLGTGWRRIRWRDVEITGGGAPRVNLSGTAAERARVVGATDVLVTITHTAERALVMAVAVADDGTGGATAADDAWFRELMDRVAVGVSRGLPDLVAGCFTADAVLVDAHGGEPHTGGDAVRHHFGSLGPGVQMTWRHLSFDAATRTGAGEFTRIDPAEGPLHAVAMVELREGRIVRWSEYPGPPAQR